MPTRPDPSEQLRSFARPCSDRVADLLGAELCEVEGQVREAVSKVKLIDIEAN